MAGYSKKAPPLARFYEQTDHAAVKANTLQLSKPNYRTALFVSAGFVAGFAVCHFGLHETSEADQNILPSLRTAVAGVPSPSSDTEASCDAAKFLAGDKSVSEPKRSLFIGTKAERWRVTVWYPTIPPQRAGEFDPMEYSVEASGQSKR